MRKWFWVSILLLVVSVLVANSRVYAATDEAVVASSSVAGDWVGQLSVPGATLELFVALSFDENEWSGTIDIPVQGLVKHPLEAIEVTEDQVTFRLSAIAGEPTFSGEIGADQLVGAFMQSGAIFPLTFNRGAAPELARPQTPQQPFPYREEFVTYDNGDVRLAGTLTIPQGEGPFPAVVLITGSGAQDRDEQLFEHRPFLLWADTLTRAGIAVLRADDRGVGESGGNLATSTTSDLAEDALAGVRLLADHASIDPDKIGLMGHSEGGVIAPLAATRSDQVAFIVMMAGTGVPGAEVLELQMQLALRVAGVAEPAVEESGKQARELYRLLEEGATDAKIGEQLVALKRAQGDPSPATPGEVAKLTSPWMRFLLKYDPRPTLAKVKVPVLAINGELDLQVDADQNLSAIGKALGNRPDVTLKRFPHLNHLFQTAKTGAFAEYSQIEQTIAPQVLEFVRDWILVQTAATETP